MTKCAQMTDCNQLPNKTSSVTGTDIINCSRNQNVKYCYEAPLSELIKGWFNPIHFVTTCCLSSILLLLPHIRLDFSKRHTSIPITFGHLKNYQCSYTVQKDVRITTRIQKWTLVLQPHSETLQQYWRSTVTPYLQNIISRVCIDTQVTFL
jgi:hypothetical protein